MLSASQACRALASRSAGVSTAVQQRSAIALAARLAPRVNSSWKWRTRRGVSSTSASTSAAKLNTDDAAVAEQVEFVRGPGSRDSKTLLDLLKLTRRLLPALSTGVFIVGESTAPRRSAHLGGAFSPRATLWRKSRTASNEAQVPRLFPAQVGARRGARGVWGESFAPICVGAY